MPIVIQKFGGTSVASAASRKTVLERVRGTRASGETPVVVVSAMGREGAPYATDTLLRLARDEGTLRQPREVDLLLSCGEVIASSILAQALVKSGVDAVSLTGAQAGIVTDDNFGNARILDIRDAGVLAWTDRGVVPVVAGFQGVTEQGDVTTLGRGGSDTTAVALGAALRAVRVEIYTDVDGVKTADPRLVPKAPTLRRISYREVSELAHLGAKVIHPRAVEIATQARLPIEIRALDGSNGGTRIDEAPGTSIEAPVVDRTVRGIAHIPRRARIRISVGDPERPDEDARELPAELPLDVFERVSGAGVSVDMIHVTPDRISFIVPDEQREQTRSALSPLGVTLQVDSGLAKVSAVGAGMHGLPGVMVRVLRALARAKVEVFDTSDSHANISCLVTEDDVPSAVVALHEEFGLGDRA